MKVLLCAVFLVAVTAGLSAPSANDEVTEKFGYVEVRPGAHMFWVAYASEASGNADDQPLILWLQGGPGASGVGFGNFMELGPRDINGNLRDGRWTQRANLLFIDNPVGTGFSYVENTTLLASSNSEIAEDLVTALKGIFEKNTEMQEMPFFIYGESYGGKMIASTAVHLKKAIASGSIICNFKGISLGDSWISPMDSVNSWGNFLYTMGFVDGQGRDKINESAENVQEHVNKGEWKDATSEWLVAEEMVLSQTDGISFYNIFDNINNEGSHSNKYSHEVTFMRNLSRISGNTKSNNSLKDALSDFMNGPQKKRWNIPGDVSYGEQSAMVFQSLEQDFMKPVISEVEDLIESGDIQVTIYTGDLDLICATPGTLRWINKMGGTTMKKFKSADRDVIQDPTTKEILGYAKRYKNFALITFLKAGHMVPMDSPYGALQMLDLNFKWSQDLDETKTTKQKKSMKIDGTKKVVVSKNLKPKVEKLYKKKKSGVKAKKVSRLIKARNKNQHQDTQKLQSKLAKRKQSMKEIKKDNLENSESKANESNHENSKKEELPEVQSNMILDTPVKHQMNLQVIDEKIPREPEGSEARPHMKPLPKIGNADGTERKVIGKHELKSPKNTKHEIDTSIVSNINEDGENTEKEEVANSIQVTEKESEQTPSRAPEKIVNQETKKMKQEILKIEEPISDNNLNKEANTKPVDRYEETNLKKLEYTVENDEQDQNQLRIKNIEEDSEDQPRTLKSQNIEASLDQQEENIKLQKLKGPVKRNNEIKIDKRIKEKIEPLNNSKSEDDNETDRKDVPKSTNSKILISDESKTQMKEAKTPKNHKKIEREDKFESLLEIRKRLRLKKFLKNHPKLAKKMKHRPHPNSLK